MRCKCCKTKLLKGDSYCLVCGMKVLPSFSDKLHANKKVLLLTSSAVLLAVLLFFTVWMMFFTPEAQFSRAFSGGDYVKADFILNQHKDNKSFCANIEKQVEKQIYQLKKDVQNSRMTKDDAVICLNQWSDYTTTSDDIQWVADLCSSRQFFNEGKAAEDAGKPAEALFSYAKVKNIEADLFAKAQEKINVLKESVNADYLKKASDLCAGGNTAAAYELLIPLKDFFLPDTKSAFLRYEKELNSQALKDATYLVSLGDYDSATTLLDKIYALTNHPELNLLSTNYKKQLKEITLTRETSKNRQVLSKPDLDDEVYFFVYKSDDPKYVHINLDQHISPSLALQPDSDKVTFVLSTGFLSKSDFNLRSVRFLANDTVIVETSFSSDFIRHQEDVGRGYDGYWGTFKQSTYPEPDCADLTEWIKKLESGASCSYELVGDEGTKTFNVTSTEKKKLLGLWKAYVFIEANRSVISTFCGLA